MENRLSRLTLQSILALFIFCCVLNASAQVNHYYVATTGSDSGSGSQSSPWKTITHAASALSLGSSGTTVHVAQGTYSECVSTNRTGTANQRIRYVSDTPQGAKIVCNASSNPAGTPTVWANGTGSNTRTADYVDIVGFEITANPAGNRCEGISSFGAFALIQGNYVHDILGQNTTTCNTQGGGGIVLRNNGNPSTVAHDSVVDGNIIDNIGQGDDGTVGDVCMTIHGIYMASPRQTATNNIISRACGWGVHMFHDTYQDVVSNNVIINNYRGGIIVSASDGFTNDNTSVINNIVAHNGGGEYGIEERWGATGSNNVYRNNMFWGNQPGNYNFANGSRTVTGTLSGSDSAVFVKYTGSAKTGDYHLQSSSPAVGAGVAGGCASGGLSPCVPSSDFDDVTRILTSAVDTGAFAIAGSSSASNAPAAPSGLTAVVQ